ncbi:MAG TPA: GGDEF domain-containing protein [Steroidobacteraceae bacterium]
MEGDDERVKQLLGQLLVSRNRRSDDKLREQLTALEDLFYAMRAMAVTDELTGVYNRRGFDWMAGRLLRHLSRERRGALLMYVDVDDLKVVNDTQGHAAGDRLLMATAQALRAACGESTIIGRIGGDEFALLARQSSAESYDLLRQRIRGAVAACNASGQAPPLSLSVGVADFDPLRPASILSLLDRADRAMYLEKFRKVPSPLRPTHSAPAHPTPAHLEPVQREDDSSQTYGPLAVGGVSC